MFLFVTSVPFISYIIFWYIRDRCYKKKRPWCITKITLKQLGGLLRGIPSIPTTAAVPIFKPIWKLNIVPIKFTKNINTPPSKEFPINFNILFNGNINILPIISKKNIQAK